MPCSVSSTTVALSASRSCASRESLPHFAPEKDGDEHEHREGRDHDQREPRRDDHDRDDAAEEHHRLAQGLRDGAGQRIHEQREIVREAARQLADAMFAEELHRQREQRAVEPLAQPHDRVFADEIEGVGVEESERRLNGERADEEQRDGIDARLPARRDSARPRRGWRHPSSARRAAERAGRSSSKR